MADKKISALTAASTPLAGTEVLPIVQSGTTVKVSVANLTAGRTAAMSLLDVENSAGGGLLGTFKSNWSTTKLSVVGDGVTGSAVLDVSNIGGTTPYGFKIKANGTETLYVDTSGNVTAPIGNLVVGTAGKGIDFSANANAPGMTSEVLTWYETGTWTPADGSGAGLSITVAAATYVRIGKMVYATFGVTYPATADASNARINGLPFTAQNSAVSMHPVAISFTTAAGLLSGAVDSNGTACIFVANGGAVLTNANLSSAIVRGTAIYEVA